MIDDWINNGSGWTIESIESQYINISTYRPLAGSSYIDVPIKTSKKKIQSTLWCHVRDINPSKEHPEKI